MVLNLKNDLFTGRTMAFFFLKIEDDYFIPL